MLNNISLHFKSHQIISNRNISSHLISSHLISSHLISSHLISSHLISPQFTPNQLNSNHITSIRSNSTQFNSTQHTSPHIISLHLNSILLIIKSNSQKPNNFLYLYHPIIRKGKMRIRRQDHMIHQSQAQNLCCLFDLGSHFDITGGWFQISGRMVMGNNDCRSIAKQGCLHHDPYIHQCGRDPAFGDLLNSQNLIRLVQIQRKERFPVVHFIRIKMRPENIHRIR